MLETCFPLQLIHSDSLLQQSLHLRPYLVLAIILCTDHRLLLKTNTLFLFNDFISLAFEVDQNFILALNLFFLVDNFLSQSVLEGYEVIRISCKYLIACGYAS